MTDGSEINPAEGLSESEAAERLRNRGYNELAAAKGRGIAAIALGIIREPMFLLLLASGAIYLGLGDIRESLMLLGFVFVVVGITLYQERKTERALEALRDLSSPRVLVVREGVRRRIPGREVVPGDIIILNEGDRVPADSVLISSVNLSVDESLLTGESVPVRKFAGEAGTKDIRTEKNQSTVFSGTLVVKGQAVASVYATGMETEIGKIGKALQRVGTESTSLQKETNRVVKKFAAAGLVLCSVIIIVYGVTRNNWVSGFLAGITLAMAILPEEFPVVLTVFLALGAWRISRRRVLTRRIPAIETLGAATVLCVDKTGTITQNRMRVSRIYARGKSFDVNYHVREALPEEFHEVIEFSMLASQRDPFDPMERAFKELGDQYLSRTEHIHTDWELVREYPLSSELLALSHVWRSPLGNEYVIAAKGAPEAIMDLCHLDGDRVRELTEAIAAMSRDGLRVLGVAKANFAPPGLPDEQHEFSFEFVGLAGLADPVRPGVRKAISECFSAGIRVIMITGDYPGTAESIARAIGLSSPGGVITGAELDAMDEKILRNRIAEVNIFARVVPEQKLRIVTALKANRETVAMTGDGVNDAPALKAADIGIAMGGRGTDVAREASALVLLDDDFSSIVQAVRLGRRIFDNLGKAIAYIFAIHVPIAGMSLIPVLLGMPLVLLPVHIVFLELIIDPACSIVFEAEPEEADVMDRPPRRADAPLFNKRTVALSLMQGLSVLFITLAVFLIALDRTGAEDARALAFTTLIIANLSLIFANRSWSRTVLETLNTRNSALWLVSGGTLIVLGLVLFVPVMRDLFGFSRLHPGDLVMCFGAGILSIIWFEGLKIANRLRMRT